ncbi:MAG: hypothetical protein E7560_04465 [Ruminococcaceae bacterium]|nr:hypothetical protein [Oscillospiraceae bacterium]
MKKRILAVVSLLLVVLIVSVAFVTDSQNNMVSAQNVNSATEESGPEFDEILKARFLNMLNHNFVYDDDIASYESVVNSSVIALLNFRDGEDDSFIAQHIVDGYVFDMFGIEDIDYSAINADFPQKPGFVYIKPCGFATFSHEILSITENEDGSYTVKTTVTIDSHDSDVYTDVCETLFVRNEKSSFGFNIVHSNIGEKTEEI